MNYFAQTAVDHNGNPLPETSGEEGTDGLITTDDRGVRRGQSITPKLGVTPSRAVNQGCHPCQGAFAHQNDAVFPSAQRLGDRELTLRRVRANTRHQVLVHDGAANIRRAFGESRDAPFDQRRLPEHSANGERFSPRRISRRLSSWRSICLSESGRQPEAVESAIAARHFQSVQTRCACSLPIIRPAPGFGVALISGAEFGRSVTHKAMLFSK